MIPGQPRTRTNAGQPRCPRCGGKMTTAPNPHYGVGLAVHRFVEECKECGWTAFPELPARMPVAQRATGLAVRLRRLWDALRRL